MPSTQLYGKTLLNDSQSEIYISFYLPSYCLSWHLEDILYLELYYKNKYGDKAGKKLFLSIIGDKNFLNLVWVECPTLYMKTLYFLLGLASHKPIISWRRKPS